MFHPISSPSPLPKLFLRVTHQIPVTGVSNNGTMRKKMCFSHQCSKLQRPVSDTLESANPASSKEPRQGFLILFIEKQRFPPSSFNVYTLRFPDILLVQYSGDKIHHRKFCQISKQTSEDKRQTAFFSLRCEAIVALTHWQPLSYLGLHENSPRQ